MAQIVFQHSQSPSGYTGGLDTVILEVDQTTNYDGSPLKIVSGSSGDDYVSLISFDISLIPDAAIIDTAVLRLHLKVAPGSASTINVFKNLLTSDYDSTLATWQTYNGAKEWSEYGARYNTKDILGDWTAKDDPDRLCKFDITGAEAAFATKTSTNNTNLVSYIQTEITSTDIVYFTMHQNQFDNVNVTFEDNENPDSPKYNPELVITYHISKTFVASCRTASFSIQSPAKSVRFTPAFLSCNGSLQQSIRKNSVTPSTFNRLLNVMLPELNVIKNPSTNQAVFNLTDYIQHSGSVERVSRLRVTKHNGLKLTTFTGLK